MAITKLADIIVPAVWQPYLTQRTTELVRVWGSGIVNKTPEFDQLANGGGQTVNMPFWNDLTGDDEVWIDAGDITPGKIGTGQDAAVKMTRARAWEHSDLSAKLAGSDPARVAADLVAAYWSRMKQKTLINILAGVFADNVANDSSDMVITKAIEDGDNAAAANKWSRDNLIEAVGTMGDHWENLGGLIVHSMVFQEMQRQGGIEFITPQDAPTKVPFFGNLRVIVDDSCPVTAGATSGNKYDCFLFGQGAIAWGEATDVKNPVELARDALGSGGTDILVTRRAFLLHPRGIRFVGTPANGVSPTNAELAAAASWDRVYDRKNVRLAKLVVNA